MVEQPAVPGGCERDGRHWRSLDDVDDQRQGHGQRPPPALRDQLRIPADEGLIATDVVADGPGAKAGLKVIDILLTMAGRPSNGSRLNPPIS